jgi:exonuclease III
LELRRKNRVEVLCLQETVKADFLPGELASISDGDNFEWVWSAAQGHSGGTLLRVKIDDVTVIGKDIGEFFTSMKIVTKHDNFKWEVVNVYGPVQLERKATFLAELGKKLQTWRILL